ncbi:MAG: hypothetical protein JWO38_3534 [Gemmataceae bacterium]|nr:hypothetical protein [Gemmataceae bacterium]
MTQDVAFISFASRACQHTDMKAEREGFEPAVGFYPHAALAKRCREKIDSGKSLKTEGKHARRPFAIAGV